MVVASLPGGKFATSGSVHGTLDDHPVRSPVSKPSLKTSTVMQTSATSSQTSAHGGLAI